MLTKAVTSGGWKAGFVSFTAICYHMASKKKAVKFKVTLYPFHACSNIKMLHSFIERYGIENGLIWIESTHVLNTNLIGNFQKNQDNKTTRQ